MVFCCKQRCGRVAAKIDFFFFFFPKSLRKGTIPFSWGSPRVPTPWSVSRIRSVCADCLGSARRRKDPLSLSNPLDSGGGEDRVQGWNPAQLITTNPSHTRLYGHTRTVHTSGWRVLRNRGSYCDVIQIAGFLKFLKTFFALLPLKGEINNSGEIPLIVQSYSEVFMPMLWVGKASWSLYLNIHLENWYLQPEN